MPADRSDIRHSTVSRWSASLGLLAYSRKGLRRNWYMTS
jgi:hypothetical protein